MAAADLAAAEEPHHLHEEAVELVGTGARPLRARGAELDEAVVVGVLASRPCIVPVELRSQVSSKQVDIDTGGGSRKA